MALPESLIAKARAYKPNSAASKILDKTRVVLVVGVSGAGKDALQQRLISKYPSDYHWVVTCTTRAPRKNKGIMEVDGQDYHFLSTETAARMLENHEFVEANVYSDNIYGTSINEIELASQESKIAICRIDVNGVAAFMDLSDSVEPIFILPPDFKTWQERLMRRYDGTHNPEDIKKRRQTALEELKHVRETQYFSLLINDDLDQATEELNFMARNEDADRSVQALQLIDHLIINLQDVLSATPQHQMSRQP